MSYRSGFHSTYEYYDFVVIGGCGPYSCYSPIDDYFTKKQKRKPTIKIVG